VKAEAPKVVEKVIPPKIIWKDDGDASFSADAAARANAEGKRAYAQEEIAKLRARIAAFAADGYAWSDGKASLADAEEHRAEAEARFSAGRYDAAYESFKEAYHIAVGANGQYVYVPKEPEQGSIDTEARARAEMKRGYAMDAIGRHEETIAYKTDALGEMHEFVMELRANLALAKESVAEGDARFEAGNYDGAYESYLQVWSELQY
jgi:tetratricopeptide (TPR) repeat protein